MEIGNQQLEDLAGIGSMGDILLSSIQRQLKLIAIHAAFSFVLFCAIALPIIACVLGGIVHVGFGIILSVMLPFFGIGLAALKKNLKIFPSKTALKIFCCTRDLVCKDV